MPKKPYHLSHVLKCEFHALWYETECFARAADAEKVIDPRLGKSHSNIPKATFSVLIRRFCQIHHFPRNSSGPLPNPQRFLPNQWLIANFWEFIIFCKKKKSSSCHLLHLVCSYLLFPSYWQLPRSHSHHIELSPHPWFICAKFFTFQRVSFPMILTFLLPLVNSHQTLSCQSQIHLFPGGLCLTYHWISPNPLPNAPFSPDSPFSSYLPPLTCPCKTWPFCHFPHRPFFLAYL